MQHANFSFIYPMRLRLQYQLDNVVLACGCGCKGALSYIIYIRSFHFVSNKFNGFQATRRQTKCSTWMLNVNCRRTGKNIFGISNTETLRESIFWLWTSNRISKKIFKLSPFQKNSSGYFTLAIAANENVCIPLLFMFLSSPHPLMQSF